jgi:hypothetical protein
MPEIVGMLRKFALDNAVLADAANVSAIGSFGGSSRL